MDEEGRSSTTGCAAEMTGRVRRKRHTERYDVEHWLSGTHNDSGERVPASGQVRLGPVGNMPAQACIAGQERKP